MFLNYIRWAFRNLRKYKGFSLINIAGLAIGLATCLMILFYVTDELSYDRYNKNADRIYRVDGDIRFGGNNLSLAVAPDAMGPTLKREFSEVDQYVRFRGYGGFMVKKGSQNIAEDRVIYADSTLFEVFSLPMIYGDPVTALIEPHSIVLTETTAKKYFNTADVVGKVLVVNDTSHYKITGVIRDVPVQSHFNFDFFVSLSTSDESRQNEWISSNFNTYILLKKGADPRKLEAQFPDLVVKYIGPMLKSVLNISLADLKKGGDHDNFSLTPLTRIHLHSNKTGELGVNGNIEYVYIFSFIAILILLIACVNFMNLSTARSANRAREVGVRKVLGSSRRNLVAQFLVESLLISLIALVAAGIIVWLLLPFFNQLSGKHLGPEVFEKPWLFPVLFLLIAVVGIIAGSYPAFFLSAFKPAEVLKGKHSLGFKSSPLRSGLVVFQFFISILLIIGTLIIYYQLEFIRNKDIGYNREKVLVLKNTDALGHNAKAFKYEIEQMPDVQKATLTGYLPTSEWRTSSPMFQDAVPDQRKAISAQIWSVDEDYIPTLGMQVVRGRNFSRDFPTDSSAIIINQAAERLLEAGDPIGKQLYHLRDYKVQKEMAAYHIVGVIKDFNFNSLRQVVTPLILMDHPQTGKMAIRIRTGNLDRLINTIEDKWKTMASGQPFNYSFMDDDFNKTYQSEQRTGRIFISFAILAILIACLGLYGLVTYAAEQRIKEIGIRKVLGATISSVVGMLSRDFVRLVLIAAIIAFPVAWWGMNKWLQQFAYRIPMRWWIFVVAGIIALLISLATVSIQAIKAARANPVDSLRSE